MPILSSCSSRTDLVVLSTGWWVLCTGLVIKQQELVTVFGAFCGSFVLATIGVWMAPDASPRILRDWVRTVLHAAALAVLALWRSDDDYGDHTTTTQSLPAEFLALSAAAGYLAFDHWYTAWHGGLCKPVWRVAEDAVTLSGLAVVLATTSLRDMHRYRTVTVLWLATQLMRGGALPRNDSLTTERPREENKVVVTPINTESDNSDKDPHNNNDELWHIQGQAYDLRAFLHRHPGGREALLLGRGRSDCTALVLSYHPFSLGQVQRTMAKYRVVVDKSEKCNGISMEGNPPADTINTQPAINKNKNNSHVIARDAFYQVLCTRVEHALRAQGLDPWKDRAAHTGRIVYYAVVGVSVLVSGYTHAVKGSILGSLVFAVTGWLIGALGHDAGHFAASRYASCNELGVWGMSLLCNPVLWQHQHTFAHHSFTNDFDADPDLHHFSTLLRVHRRFTHAGIYHNQRHLPFVVLAYALVVFGECVWIPLGMLREGTLYGLVAWTDRKSKAIGMYAHLLAYVAIVLVAPFWTAPSLYNAMACVVLHIATSGLLFGFFSQINHLNETSIETKADAKDSWAAHQVETSNNFCPDSVLWYYLSNGLNLQIEHHLFPGLNHCHLWRIAPIVQATCKEYGVMYKSWDTWSDLWGATRAWLDQLASQEMAPDKHAASKS